MNLIKKIIQFFRKEKEIKEPTYEREMRELLRENLNTIAVDIFHYNDPIMMLNPAERREYLVYFFKLVREAKVIDRLKYLINKQANLTLMNSKSGILDSAGVMKLDGLGTFKDDLERLAKMFEQEEAERENGRPPSQPYGI